MILQKSNNARYRPPKQALDRVRSASVDEEVWSADLFQEYVKGKCNGFAIYGGGNDCDYLASLPGLERVLVDYRGLKDDSGIFEATSLKVLEIYRGGRGRPLPAYKLPNLRELRCDETRTQLSGVRDLDHLVTLSLELSPKTTDLAWLGYLPALEVLELSGRNHHLDIGEVLSRLPSLRSLVLSGFTVRDLNWLSHDADRLEHLMLFDVHSPSGRGFDVTPAAAIPTLREFYCRRVHSLEPLKDLRLGYLEIDRIDDQDTSEGQYSTVQLDLSPFWNRLEPLLDKPVGQRVTLLSETVPPA